MRHRSAACRTAPLALTAAALGALATACSGGNQAGDGGHDGASDASADANRCVPNVPFCRNNGYYNCDATGQESLQMLCTGSTPTCVAGVGCQVCQAGTRRCSDGTGGTPQLCAADGASWQDQTACTGSNMCVEGICLDPCGEAARARSYEGCDYYPVTLRNTCLADDCRTEPCPDFRFAVAVTNPQTVDVTVTVEGGALSAAVTQTVHPGELDVIELPWVPEVAQIRQRAAGSVIKAGGAYHLHSNLPVIAYQFNPLQFSLPDGDGGMRYSYSNDASLLLPTSVLGTRYSALMWPGVTFQIGNTPPWDSGGTITVVGTDAASTHVTVNLASGIVAGTGVAAANQGDTVSYDLAQGDVLQLVGLGTGTDLSGSLVTSSAPVAVFTGHGCSEVPVGRLAGDHLEEQTFPDNIWGKKYAVSHFADRPTSAPPFYFPSVVRVMAQSDGTMVTFDPPSAHAAVMLNARQMIELDTTTDFVVSGDKPILVAQFMYGQGQDTTLGDPSMVYETPVEQYRASYTFLAPSSFPNNFVNIVSPAGQTPLLDHMPVMGVPKNLGSSGYTLWTVPINPGVHTVGDEQSGVKIGLKVYGDSVFTSYAYPGGLDLQVITPG